MNKTLENLKAELKFHLDRREQLEEMLAAELHRCHLETDYTRRLRNSIGFDRQRIQSVGRTVRTLEKGAR